MNQEHPVALGLGMESAIVHGLDQGFEHGGHHQVLRDVTSGFGPRIDLEVEGKFDGESVSGTFVKTIFGVRCNVNWEARALNIRSLGTSMR